jgi:capsular exopolysaccharide synthesis family protein
MELARRDREIGASTVTAPAPAPARLAVAGPAARVGGHSAQANGGAVPSAVRVDAATLEANRILGATSPESMRQAYKMLRTQVLQRMREHGCQTLALISGASGEGKSLTAANLAISIALDADRAAVLVDLDLRHPSVHTLFGLTPAHGLDDYLAGRCSLKEVCCRPDMFERLALLPVRAPVANSSDLLSGSRARELIAEIKSTFPDSIVLIDLPPVLMSDDALAFSPSVDAGLVVACEGKTKREDLVRTLELLRATKIVGTVLNRSSEPGSGVY